MSPRLKKLVGFLAFLPLLTGYFFAAAALGERLPNLQLVKAAYFLVAGVAWALPARYLMRWMEAPARPKSSHG